MLRLRSIVSPFTSTATKGNNDFQPSLLSFDRSFVMMECLILVSVHSASLCV